MNDALQNAQKKQKQSIVEAIVSYNKKNNKNSKFYIAYEEYWKIRDEEEINQTSRRIEKRAHESLEQIAENVFDSIVESSKRLRGNSSRSNNTNNSTSSNCDSTSSNCDSTSSNCDSTSSNSNSSSCDSTSSNSNSSSCDSTSSNSDSNIHSTATTLDEITSTYKGITGLQILYIDDDGVKIMLEKELLDRLTEQSTLPGLSLSSSATLLLESLNRANCDFYTYRGIIKDFKLPANERFDVVTHADLNFVETMGNHFLNLNQSPGNPLLQPTLERTAAIHTTIALLNNLFLSVNDKISFSWIEIETILTKSTKWDGVGFKTGSDKKIGYCLVEFSGGIKRNCKSNKAGHDEMKIEKGVIDFMEYTGAAKSHFIRFHDMKLYFELVFFIENSFIRRTHATIKLPTTPSELIAFFNQTSSLFTWKKSLTDSTNDESL
ncbi:hypothetical protein MBANPS3_008787 [Mucor bainieri]